MSERIKIKARNFRTRKVNICRETAHSIVLFSQYKITQFLKICHVTLPNSIGGGESFDFALIRPTILKKKRLTMKLKMTINKQELLPIGLDPPSINSFYFNST